MSYNGIDYLISHPTLAKAFDDARAMSERTGEKHYAVRHFVEATGASLFFASSTPEGSGLPVVELLSAYPSPEAKAARGERMLKIMRATESHGIAIARDSHGITTAGKVQS